MEVSNVWNGSMRIDGLMIVNVPTYGWIIYARSAAANVTECPCCGTPLVSERAARLVADTLYPLEQGSGDEVVVAEATP